MDTPKKGERKETVMGYTDGRGSECGGSAAAHTDGRGGTCGDSSTTRGSENGNGRGESATARGNKRRRAYAVAAIAATAAGCALHFLYDVLPNPLTALISPINESVWEHLKLLFFPTLAAATVLSRRERRPHRLWSGFFAALLAMPLGLTGTYYLLSAGFGVASLAADITLYVLTMLCGFWLAYRLRGNGRLEREAPWLLLPVALYGSSLILFTFAAPPLPIFLPPQ